MKFIHTYTIVLIIIMAGCQSEKPAAVQKAPIFDNLGKHTLKITTVSEEAQKFFNQGLNLAYGFNHAEAARSFQYAATLDPNCAMCYWGAAYVLGPNINLPMDTSVVKSAYEGAQKALELSANASDWEKAIIQALVKRYTSDKEADRAPLDSAYSADMREAFNHFPGNTDIGALFAESLMDLHPWDFYLHDGTPQEWTPEIVQVLEHVISIDSLHPGGNHFYIHATEASYTADRALPSAKRLETLVPASGHLVHMPSHTYIRTGNYHEGSMANIKATSADSLYTAACYAQGFYPLAYIPHNHHFLATCALLEGDSKTAIPAAFETVKHTEHSVLTDPGFEGLQHFITIPYVVLVKFAKWDDILALPAPKEEMKYPVAMWTYAKGKAYCGKKQLPEAEQELARLKELAMDTSLKKVVIFINTAWQVTNIAALELEEDIERSKGNLDNAISLLQQATALEDDLHYNEPPDWLNPVRHEFGSALIAAGKYAEAEKAYQDDLQKLPENGWALNELYTALIKQKKMNEAEAVKTRLDKAWQHADVKLEDSRVGLETSTAQM